MARISGVDLPRRKRIEIGLTYIYGIMLGKKPNGSRLVQPTNRILGRKAKTNGRYHNRSGFRDVLFQGHDPDPGDRRGLDCGRTVFAPGMGGALPVS